MLTDVVNTITFDFTCNSEAIARDLQREIQNYVLPRISTVVEDVLKDTSSDEVRQIARIEIDLGDIDEKAISASILNKFKSLFDIEVGKAVHVQHYNQKGDDVFFAKSNTVLNYADFDFSDKGTTYTTSNSLSSIDSEFGIIKEFLLHGDLPWWVSKNSLPDLDRVMKHLIHVQPEKIRYFLAYLKNNKQVVLRLKSQFLPTTLERLKALVPDINKNHYFNTEKSDSGYEENLNEPFDLLTARKTTKRSDILSSGTIDNSPDTNIGLSEIGRQDSNHSFTDELKNTGFVGPGTTHEGKISHVSGKDPTTGKIERNYQFRTEKNNQLTDGELAKRTGEQGDLAGSQTNNDVFIEILTSLSKVFGRQINPNKDLKTLLILQLMQRFDVLAMNKIRMLNGFSPKETSTLYSYFIENRKSAFRKQSVIKILQRLNYFQIEFLLHISYESSQKLNLELHADVRSVDQKNTFKPPAKLKRVSYLLSKLVNSSNILLQEPNRNTLSSGTSSNFSLSGNDSNFSASGSASIHSSPVNDSSPGLPGKNTNLSSPVDYSYSGSPGNKNNFGLSADNDNLRSLKSSGDAVPQKDSSIILSEELFNYSKDDLIRLEKLFQQYNLENYVKIRLINSLVENPFVVKYNLLQLPAKLSLYAAVVLTDKHLAKELETYKTELTAALNKLSTKQSVIIDDIFEKGLFVSDFERKTLIDLLQKLSVPGLTLISKFASLSEDQVKALLENNGPAKNDSLRNFLQAELNDSSQQKAKKIIVENAGLCLVAPYLSRLFNNLGYIEKRKFKSKAHRMRALFVLEYIATGSQRNPEYMLQLNKVLCGLRTEDWITGNKRLTAKERTEADDLLLSVIENWKSLNRTSLNGLRTSFIQRKGLLFEDENAWILQIEKKGYDVLLDSVPWSFNLIKLPWMKKMIQVEW